MTVTSKLIKLDGEYTFDEALKTAASDIVELVNHAPFGKRKTEEMVTDKIMAYLGDFLQKDTTHDN